MCTGRITTARKSTLVGIATAASQEEFLTFPSAYLAFRANVPCHYILLLRGGLQPLCGSGVTSFIAVIVRPTVCRVLIAASLPGPGPFMRTSTFLTPSACASRAAASAHFAAAYAVPFLVPLNPIRPADDQQSTLPFVSAIDTIVLLNVAKILAIPVASARAPFLRLGVLIGFFTYALLAVLGKQKRSSFFLFACGHLSVSVVHVRAIRLCALILGSSQCLSTF